MYEKYFSPTKLEQAQNVVKLHGEKPHKTETTNKVWGEAAKPAPVRLYEQLTEENPELLKKENQKELIDRIYRGLGGLMQTFKSEKEYQADKAAKSRAMTRRFA